MQVLAAPLTRMLGVGVVLAGLVAFLGPAQAGVLAMAAAAVRCAEPVAARRLAAVEDAACLAFLVSIYGFAGAGAFAVAVLAAVAPIRALVLRWRPATALIVTAGAGALMAAVSSALSGLGPERWASAAALAPALFLAAPAGTLMQIAVKVRGEEAAANARLQALGPLLVALVVGAGIGGLTGAGCGWAAVRLATPLILLMTAERRARLVGFGAGVLAAGLPAAAAAGLALAYADAHPAALPAVAVIGLAVFAVGLRVHAPAAARRLARRVARLTRPAGINQTDPSPRPDAA
jgi:hypothetical protein